MTTALWESYHSVTSREEALALLAEHGAAARVIAGGTDILLELERGQRTGVKALIDISRVPGLAEITIDGDEAVLGPMALHNQVVAHAVLRERALPLVQACWEVGAPQIRNRATVAGNLITASPANDTITPLMALGARVELTSARGVRVVPIAEFYTGLRRTVMQPDELLTALRVTLLAPHERGIFIKLGLRRAQAISVVNVAAVVGLEDGRVTGARLALGSVAPTIIRLPAVEALLAGRALTPETIREAALLAGSIPKPIDDVRAPAAYRSESVRVLVSRALRTLAEGKQAAQLPAEDAPMLWGPLQGQPALAVAARHGEAEPIVTTINGQVHRFSSGQHKTLLRLLREDGGLPGTKEGCAEGECGACTVFLDGAAVMACLVPAPRAHGAEIVTVEGLAEEGTLHPVQQAFVEHGAVQCGYCTPGLIMSGAKLLEECPQPTRTQAEQSVTGNLCRCTGYYPIIEALVSAGEKVEAVT
jgi:carbon-monoxide dehydrogenase medium subunit